MRLRYRLNIMINTTTQWLRSVKLRHIYSRRATSLYADYENKSQVLSLLNNCGRRGAYNCSKWAESTNCQLPRTDN